MQIQKQHKKWVAMAGGILGGVIMAIGQFAAPNAVTGLVSSVPVIGGLLAQIPMIGLIVGGASAIGGYWVYEGEV